MKKNVRAQPRHHGIAAPGAKAKAGLVASFSISLGSVPLATSHTQTQQIQCNIENE
jgi:hypothetical protein